jgi:hypothetical protein
MICPGRCAMPAIKKFNWVNRPSRWQSAQAWSAQRKRMAQQFLNDSSIAGDAFLGAQQNMTVGKATLAAQASIKRTQAAIDSARSQFSSAAGSINKLA